MTVKIIFTWWDVLSILAIISSLLQSGERALESECDKSESGACLAFLLFCEVFKSREPENE